MRKEQVWAVAAEQVKAFFQEQPDVTAAETGFCFAGCQIMLTALPPKGEGFWRTPQTRVVMEGPEADVNAIYRRFFLQFLSAGG